MSSPASRSSRAEKWKSLEQAIEQQLPRTAIEILDLIIPEAIADEAHVEAVKAIVQTGKLQCQCHDRSRSDTSTRIRVLKSYAEEAPQEIIPLLDLFLAQFYWSYFHANEWRVKERTATDEPLDDDVTNWDRSQIVAEVERLFQRTLSAGDNLKGISISDADDLLSPGTLPDSYRPTVYDYAVHEALGFYGSKEHATSSSENRKSVPAESPALGSAEEFIAWQIERGVFDPYVEKALVIYQGLLGFHRNDPDPSAFLDSDLHRLDYGQRIAVGETTNERYTAALIALADRWAKHELSSEALHRAARVAFGIVGELDALNAHRLASRGADAFPESSGGRQCQELLESVEKESFVIHTDRVWNGSNSRIAIYGRNIDRLFFRAVSCNWNELLDAEDPNDPIISSQEKCAERLKAKPAAEWEVELPGPVDYKDRRTSVAAPTTLESGCYLIAASSDRTFARAGHQVAFAGIWVSHLAVIARAYDGQIEGIVLDSKTGEPVQGAEVHLWANRQGRSLLGALNELRSAVVEQERQNAERRKSGVKETHDPVELSSPLERSGIDHTVFTNKDGFFEVPEVSGHLRGIQVIHSNQRVGIVGIKPQPSKQDDSYEATFFFTDRSIYRPGQLIHYKVLCVLNEPSRCNCHVLSEKDVTVVFADSNRTEIARQQHKTNEYGSFSSSFLAPQNRILGRAELFVVDGPTGAKTVRIEEYKRPKIEVTLKEPPVDGAHLF